jgi:FixJ family two-component response regulator
MPLAVADERRPVIVIVDDDPAVCSSLKFSLELEGYRVRTFADAGALLADDDVSTSQCLILDYKLPGLNGLELLEKLRARHVTVPAIMITSHPSRALRDLAARARIRIIEKPLLTDALIEEIRAVCRVV